MRNVNVNTGTTSDEYSARGREIARKIDTGEAIEAEFTLTFEDPADMFAVMTSARLELFRAAKAYPASITAIAHRLHRDRSTVNDTPAQKTLSPDATICLIPLSHQLC